MRIDYTQNALAKKGRNGDKYMAHVAEGEMIVPPVISDETRARVLAEMEAAGIPLEQYQVGGEVSINPETGLPEFGFLKKIFRPVAKLVNAIPGGELLTSIALTAAGQPELAALLKTTTSLGNGGSLGSSLLSGALSYGGSALGGSDTVFGNSISGALKGGLDSIGSGVSGALGKIGDATGLGSLYNDASGALSSAKNSVSDALGSAYNGSGLQSAFNSGSDALKSFGLGSGATTSNAAVGGGGSSYGSTAADGFGYSAPRGTASSLLNSIPSEISNLSDITTNNLGLGDTLASGGNVASKTTDFYSPLASLGVGAFSNNSAEKALLKQANANKALLAPYQNFQFNPGDLTQDPGYQFNLAQGDQALSRRQAANGNYFSGAAGKELQEYGQGLADNTYNAAFNRALQTNQTGYNNALGMAGINDSIGNIKASGAINNGNLFSGALGSMLGGNSYTNSGALQGGTDIQALLRRLGYAA